jgi:protein SCO1/2
MRRKAVLGIVAAAALWVTAASVAAQNSRWGANYFPNVPLTTQDGKVVHFYDDLLKGKIVAINLIYTTCKYACPLETARLAQVQKVLGDRMGRDVFFYSITIDPDHDTPEVLKEYSQRFHAGPGWQFLTGKAADIELISKKIGLYTEPDLNNPDGHQPNLLIGNETTGQWMRNSALDNPQFMATTIGDWLNSWQTARKDIKSYADVPKMTLDRGEYTFKNHCAACHTIGKGDHIGPDLAGITTVRERAWLQKFIYAPDKMLAAGDPIAKQLYAKYKNLPMPNLALSGEDVGVLVDYLGRQSAVKPSAPAAQPPAAANVSPVVDPYLRMHDALSADSMQGVKDAARVVAVQAMKIGTSAEAIRVAASGFEQAADLPATRAAFRKLGDAIIIYAKASKAPLGDGVSVVYCPMQRAYWLQKGTAIRNPYYGKSMLECGRVTADLPTLGS